MSEQEQVWHNKKDTSLERAPFRATYGKLRWKNGKVTDGEVYEKFMGTMSQRNQFL